MDSDGKVIDFWLSEHRDQNSARKFLQKAIRAEHNHMPAVITTEKYPAAEVANAEEIYLGYVFTIAWGIAALLILSDYFRRDFKSVSFSAPQWGLVCTLVGSQVLGVYVNGYYFKTPILNAVNYASVIAAVIIYGIVMVKFVRSLVPQVQKS